MILRRRAAQLLRLFDGRDDNPLIRYGHPGRSWQRAVKYWGFIGAAWCVAILVGLLIEQESSSDAAVVFCVTEVAMLPLLTLGCLYLFGHSLRDPSHLEDLHLTPLPRREAAFGAVWWGCAAAAMAYLPFWLTSFVLEVIHLPESEVVHAAGRVLLGPVVFVYCLAIAARVWIDHGPRLLATVFRAIGVHLLSVVYLYMLVFVLMFGVLYFFLDRVFGEPRDWVVWGMVLGLALCSAGFWVATACRFAGNRMFAAIDPESLARDSWVANDRLAAKEKREQRAALARLWRQRRPDTICDTKGIGVAFAILFVGACVGLARGLDPGASRPILGALRGGLGFSALLAAPVYAVVASLFFRARGRDDTILPAVAGDINGTAIVSILLPGLPFLLLAAATLAADLLKTGVELSSWAVLAIIGAGISLPMGALLMSVATSLLPRGRRRWIAAAWFAAAALFHLGPLLDMGWFARNTIFFFDIGERGMGLYALTGGAALLWAALGIYASGQRLFERELRHLPWHTLTTDFAFPPGIPTENTPDADSPGAGLPCAETPEPPDPAPPAADNAPADPSIRC